MFVESFPTGGNSHCDMLAPKLIRTHAPRRLFDPVVECRSSVFYGEEREGKITIEIVRLGPNTSDASVHFRSVSGSACAGQKYHHVEGVLRFESGESVKAIEIDLIENDAYEGTLEFAVELFNPECCTLGDYLWRCRVVIVDDDTYPSNRFATRLRARRISSIPQGSLMVEFVRLALRIKDVRRAALKNALVDQILNFRYVYNVLLMNFLIDGIMLVSTQAEDENARPSNYFHAKFHSFFSSDLERVCVVVGLSTVPHFLTIWLSRGQIQRRTRGHVVRSLQGSLFRRFFNYTDPSRKVVCTTDLVMAMTRDIPDLVQSGLLSSLSLVRELGLLGILMVTIYYKKGAMQAWLIVIFFVAYVALMYGFLLIRQGGIERRQAARTSTQNKMAQYIQNVATNCRLVADYNQQPSAVAGLEKKVAEANEATTDAELHDSTSREFTHFLTTIFMGLYIICQFQTVIDEECPFGDFVAGIAMWKTIGNCFENLYGHLMSMQRSVEQNRRVVTFMNLPIEVPDRMRLHRQSLAEAETLRKSRTGGDAGHNGYMVDSQNFMIQNFAFRYPECTGGTEVFKDVNLCFPLGTLVAVAGPRAGGKATLLNLLGGVLLPMQTSAIDVRTEENASFFIPPHLRVLHVSHQPLFLEDLNLFENLCYGPSDGIDERASRVVAICKRLGISEDLLDGILRDAPADQDNKLFQRRLGSQIFEESLEQRVHLDIMKAQPVSLSETDLVLLHLARAFIMNPEVLVIHKPLSHFDDSHARTVMELMREYVDFKGLEKPDEEYETRQPRTCIFSEHAARSPSAKIDVTLYCSDGQVKVISTSERNELVVAAHHLFSLLDVNDKNQVTYESFANAVRKTPWVMKILGLTVELFEGSEEERDDALRDVFGKVDRRCCDEVDFELIVEYLLGLFESNLPGVLMALAEWKLSCVSPCSTPRVKGLPEELLVVPNELPTPGARSSSLGLQEFTSDSARELIYAFGSSSSFGKRSTSGPPKTPHQKHGRPTTPPSITGSSFKETPTFYEQ